MRKPVLIVLSAIVLFFVVMNVSWYLLMLWHYHGKGGNIRHYSAPVSVMEQDGTITVVASLSFWGDVHQNVVLQHYTPDAKLQWEHFDSFHSPNWRQLIHPLFRPHSVVQELRPLSLSATDKGYLLLLTRTEKDFAIPYLLSFDKAGKLSGHNRIEIKADKNDAVLGQISGNTTWLAYTDNASRLMCLSQVETSTGKSLYTAMKSYKQKHLRLVSMAARADNRIVNFSGYDSELGASYYMYSKELDLTEVLRESTNIHITTLRYLHNTLYVTTSEDSFLIVSDFTDMNKPRHLLDVNPHVESFTPTGVMVQDSTFYVSLEHGSEDKPVTTVQKYKSDQKLYQQFLLPGKVEKLYLTTDGTLLAVREELKGNYGKVRLSRVE